MACVRLGEDVVVREETIKKACSLGNKANKTPTRPFLYEKIKNSSEVIFALSGSWSINDFFTKNNDPFGATKIDEKVFPSMRNIGLAKAAYVNEAFMLRFTAVMTNQKFKDKVEKACMDGKQIVFTGNFTGGPIAILVTIWFLEVYIRSNADRKAPICVTFGSPLVGDRFISHALRREKWSHYFIHFVTRYDIFPLVLLAPRSSVESQLELVLNYLTPRSQSNGRASETAINSAEVSALYLTVLMNTSSVASFAACKMMGNTNPLAETLSSIINLSPYRPSGIYVFCCNRKLVVVRNPDAVLQILSHSWKLSSKSELERVAQGSLLHHLNYEHELNECLEMQSVTCLEDHYLEAIPLSSEDTNNESATILNDLELSVEARLCLRAAAETEKQKLTNQVSVDGKMKEIENGLNELQNGYKSICATRELGYYEAFRMSDCEKDFDANITRLDLAGLWDEITEKLKGYELPDGFECREEWIELGTKYRRLVEPLDIANFYRHGKNEDTGPYMGKGRPKRYICTQRWLEHSLRKPSGSLEVESCFWAELEELYNIKGSPDFTNGFLKLEERIRRSIADGGLREDVLNDSIYINLKNQVG